MIGSNICGFSYRSMCVTVSGRQENVACGQLENGRSNEKDTHVRRESRSITILRDLGKSSSSADETKCF